MQDSIQLNKIAFKTLFLCLIFSIFSMVCLCASLFFTFILFGVFWAWMCRLICFISSGGSFQPLFLWPFFLFLFPPFWYPHDMHVSMVIGVPYLSEALLSFLNFFFLSFGLYKLSWSIFKFAEYFYSVCSKLMLNLSSDFFFFLVIVLVNFRISICFYFIISLFLVSVYFFKHVSLHFFEHIYDGFLKNHVNSDIWALTQFLLPGFVCMYVCVCRSCILVSLHVS